MPELEVLGDGHLKLDYADWKEFFQQELDEWVRSHVASCSEALVLPMRGVQF